MLLTEWDEEGEAAPRQPTPLSALPFDGAHVLEFCELTAFDTSTHLESFLAQFDTGRLAPIVRRVKLKTLICKTFLDEALKPRLSTRGFSNPPAADPHREARRPLLSRVW